MKKFDSHESANRIQEEFGGDVKYVTGNMFLVRREIIEFAKAGLSSIDGELVYGNPRWFINKEGKQEAKGIDSGKMKELKNSIRERGVDHPVRLRVAEDAEGNFLEVVNGERRLRAIAELCESDEECWDSTIQKKRPASEVYEWVECRVEHMDDATALCCALQLNETSEIIGDAANIHVVKVLKDSGYGEPEILKATGKSISWLREMMQIIGLDEVCLKHYQSDMINKRVALRLALIKDVEERVARLDKIMQAASERHLEEIRKTRLKAEKAMEEVAEADMEDFKEAISQSDSDEKPASKKKGAVARKKAEKINQELEEVSSKKATANSKDADKADGSSKPLSHKKISSKMLKPLLQLIADEGLTEDGEFDVASLVLIQAVLEAILSGDSDLMSILGEHCSVTDDAAAGEDEAGEDEAGEDEADEDYEVADVNAEADEGEDADDEDEDEDDYASYEASESELEQEFEKRLRSVDRD